MDRAALRATEPAPEWFGSQLGIFALIILFYLCLSPLAACFLTHHPDERHYTDAAIEMIRRDDYLTPYAADGRIRLNKPIVTYWMTVASYLTFGIAPWSSRLPFLLTGGGIVGLTYALALRLQFDRRWAQFAALVVACNPSLIISTPRSVPDVPLAFFLMLAILGFVSLIVTRQSNWHSLMFAYGGTAFAVLSKGLPAIVFAAYAIVVLLAIPDVRQSQSWRRHAIAVVGCVVVSSSWFVVMYLLHGDALPHMFYRDQVGARVAHSARQCVQQLLSNLALVGVSFAVWAIPVLAVRRKVQELGRRTLARPEYLFLSGWIVLWVGSASLVDRVNLRYLLPITPLLSIWVAQTWRAVESPRLLRVTRPIWQLALVALAGSSLACAASLGYFGQVGWALAIVGVGIGLVTLLLRASQGANSLRLASLGVIASLAMVALGSITLMPMVLPDTGARIADELRKLSVAGPTPLRILFVGQPAIAARTRVYLQGSASVIYSHHLRSANLAKADVIVAPDDADLGPEWLPLESLKHGFGKTSFNEILKAAARGDLDEHLAVNRRRTTIAVRRALTERNFVRAASWSDGG